MCRRRTEFTSFTGTKVQTLTHVRLGVAAVLLQLLASHGLSAHTEVRPSERATKRESARERARERARARVRERESERAREPESERASERASEREIDR
jgi:hypothetical protein